MKIGIFDHLDNGGQPLAELYENRLKLIERYDAAGIYAYHVAEHHGTPLGMTPAPGIFLSAVAQRTSRIRLGPLVYCLPFYHPIRLFEEICMLDHLSGGRLDFGVGPGISEIEARYYGFDPAVLPDMYREALELILRAMAGGELTFEGKYFNFHGVPLEFEPLQRPHPPLWYGIANPKGSAWPAENGVNIVSLAPAPIVREITDRYRAHWADLGRAPEDLPCLGMNRNIVVADSDDEALDIARRAYQRWLSNFMLLWHKTGLKPPFVKLPPDFDGYAAAGLGFAGSPARVLDELGQQIEAAGVNYVACGFAFGDLTLEESSRSLDLFVDKIMLAL